MTVRDDFNSSVVRRLAARAGHRCSNPACRRPTSGPGTMGDGSVNIGVAAHITAAAPGGPRFDPQLSASERSAIGNGIWLCQVCAKSIDSDVARFTSDLLLGWKSSAEVLAQTRLETPERPEGPDEPILSIPNADATVSWLPFSARATTLVGRSDETERVQRFLKSDLAFSWWLITGPAGAGKSRLALELCRGAGPTWNAGFLSRADTFARWPYYRPSRPTLIVVDYVVSRVAEISSLLLQLARAASYLPNPVRVLLVERDLGSWWSRLLREDSPSESAELLAPRYDEPLRLGPLAPEALRTLAADVAHSRKIAWSESTAREFDLQMRTLDPLGRPLFGMIAAAYRESDIVDEVADSAVLRRVLKKERGRWRQALGEGLELRRMENLVAFATLMGGVLPKSDGFAFLSSTDVGELLPQPALIDGQQFRDFSATSDEKVLSGLQPDIVGERFLLDRFKDGLEVAANTRRLVLAAWSLQPGDLCDFIVRAASDFPGDAAIDTLCDLPLDLPEARARWGRLVGDLIHIADRSADARTQRLLEKLRAVADRWPKEAELQQAAAGAELSLGNVFLFAERDYTNAATQFDAAIARAGSGSEIEAAAINNRGILHHEIQEEESAFADWSNVIARPDASDEARACSLNNRADIFARRGAHNDAIHDRSSVLMLRETSPDRRYIALARRSHSYQSLGDTESALRDLGTILEIVDIAPEQKAEARMARSAIYDELWRLDAAKIDLEAVIATPELFPGTLPLARVRLADLARRRRDPAHAHELLRAALDRTDIASSTLVEALIVRARLLEDAGDLSGAESVWQSVITNPGANERQRSLAANRRSAP